MSNSSLELQIKKAAGRVFQGSLAMTLAFLPISQSIGQLPPRRPLPGVASGGGSSFGSGKVIAPSKDSSSPLSPEQKEKFAKAKPEEITNENFPEVIESFDYPNADLEDVIKAMAELTGKNFIIDNGVRGKITIIAPSQITVAEAWKAFLTALALNQFTIVPSGNFLKIRTARNASRDSLETYAGDYFPNTDQVITRIIHLKYISAEAVTKDLKILASKEGEIEPYKSTNSLIMTDYGSNVERVERILKELDVPGFEEKMEVMPVFHAKAVDIANLIDKIVNKDSSNSSSSSSRSAFRTIRPPVGSSGSSDSSSLLSFMVIPDERSNSLVVVGNQGGIARVRKLLKSLDFPLSAEESGTVHVYYVKHGDATTIADTLNGVAEKAKSKNDKKEDFPVNRNRAFSPDSFGGSAFESDGASGATSGKSGGQVFGGDIGIVADETTNSLIISASRQDYEAVLNLLKQIDIARDQVFVEAIIMEMNLTNRQDYGISVYNFDQASGGLARQGFNGLGTDLLSTITNPVGGNGTILAFGGGKDVTLNLAGLAAGAAAGGAAGAAGGLAGLAGAQNITVKSVTGLVQLLQQTTDSNVLSTPQIIALDNEEAEIEVGDKIPVGQSVNQINQNVQQTPIFEEATIKLKIKPFISPDSEAIRLEVDQQIREPVSRAPIGGNLSANAVATTKRTLKTMIVLNNGDTVVLGGLMQDKVVEEETKVPFLGDIPILGWLFKSTNSQRAKVNLMVFLTPKIIRSGADNRKLTRTKIDERIEFIKRASGVDSYGYKLEEIARRNEASEQRAEEKSAVQDPTGVDTLGVEALPIDQEKLPSQDENLDTLEDILQEE